MAGPPRTRGQCEGCQDGQRTELRTRWSLLLKTREQDPVESLRLSPTSPHGDSIRFGSPRNGILTQAIRIHLISPRNSPHHHLKESDGAITSPRLFAKILPLFLLPLPQRLSRLCRGPARCSASLPSRSDAAQSESARAQINS